MSSCIIKHYRFYQWDATNGTSFFVIRKAVVAVLITNPAKRFLLVESKTTMKMKTLKITSHNMEPFLVWISLPIVVLARKEDLDSAPLMTTIPLTKLFVSITSTWEALLLDKHNAAVAQKI